MLLLEFNNTVGTGLGAQMNWAAASRPPGTRSTSASSPWWSEGRKVDHRYALRASFGCVILSVPELSEKVIAVKQIW